MAKYPNLVAEMARRDVSCAAIARSLKVCDKTAKNKVAGRVEFTWPEAKTIHTQFFPDVQIDVLFATNEQAS